MYGLGVPVALDFRRSPDAVIGIEEVASVGRHPVPQLWSRTRLQHRFQHLDQRVHLGLLEYRGGAELCGDAELIGLVDASAAGDCDDLHVRPLALHLKHGADAVLLRHHDVSHDH